MATEKKPEDELEKRRAEEYQMQLFGLHSRTVFAAIEQKLKSNVETRCHKLYTSVEKKYNPDCKERNTLKNNVKQLQKAYQHNMQPHLIAIKNIVNKFIVVPDNILLEEDKVQAKQYTDEEFRNLERRLENLQQKARRVTMFNAALKEELEVAEAIKESEDAARKLCTIIGKGLSAKKINNKTVRAIDKSKDLTESLNSIKPLTQKEICNPNINENELDQNLLNM